MTEHSSSSKSECEQQIWINNRMRRSVPIAQEVSLISVSIYQTCSDLVFYIWVLALWQLVQFLWKKRQVSTSISIIYATFCFTSKETYWDWEVSLCIDHCHSKASSLLPCSWNNFIDWWITQILQEKGQRLRKYDKMVNMNGYISRGSVIMS